MANDAVMKHLVRLSDLKGHDWLVPFSSRFSDKGLRLSVRGDTVVISNPETQHWIGMSIYHQDQDYIVDWLEDMLTKDFESEYGSPMWEPVDDEEEEEDPNDIEVFERIARRTVDNLLSEDEDADPKAAVGDFMKSYTTAHPIGPHPAEADVAQDRMLRGVKVLGKYYLFLWDTYRRSETGHTYLGYRFVDPKGVILFQGTDYGCPGGSCVDSDETVAGLLKWFTLKPGDTDDEYFEAYTPEQMVFATSDDAQQLALDLEYGHGEGNVEGYSKPWVDLPGYEHDDPEE